MSSVVAALSDDRLTTSTVIVFGPLADTIFRASCSSAPPKSCALPGTENKARTQTTEPAARLK